MLITKKRLSFKFLFEPFFLLISTHVICVFLIFFVESGIFHPYRWQVFQLVLFIIFFSSLGYIFGRIVKPSLSSDEGFFKKFSVRFFGIRPLIISLFVLSLADYLYSGGFPLFSIIDTGGGGPSSTSYGMPLVHGLQKAIQFLLFAYVVANRNYFSYSFVFLLLLPFLELSRSSLLIYFFIYFNLQNVVKTQRSFKFFPSIIALSLSLIFFIVFGDTRDTTALEGLVDGASITVIWFYTYFVCGLANLSEIVRQENLVLIYTALNSVTGWYPLYSLGSIYLLTLGALGVGLVSGLMAGEIKSRFIPLKAIFTSGLALMFFGNFLLNNAYLFMIIFLYLFTRVRLLAER